LFDRDYIPRNRKVKFHFYRAQINVPIAKPRIIPRINADIKSIGKLLLQTGKPEELAHSGLID
jgi:hypothetical protein